MNRNDVTREEYLALAGQVANGLHAYTGFLADPDDIAESVLERTDALAQKLNERFAQEVFLNMTTDNTPELKDRITHAAATCFKRRLWQIDAIYSDGEWYVYYVHLAPGSAREPVLIKHRVVESDGEFSVDGFSFELNDD